MNRSRHLRTIRTTALLLVTVGTLVAAVIGPLYVPAAWLPFLAAFYLTSMPLAQHADIPPVGVNDPWTDARWQRHLKLIALRGLTREEANTALERLCIPRIPAKAWTQATAPAESTR
ncbi:hypothetical protein [Nonomuraea longicatena]|uniref:Uncharacterized protein n=1 Tax=Nonomuraea longicatena TaxID=83682 RepID=A0ABP3ZX42_9ACTN